MIVTTKKLFEAAYGKYAIGAYNINNSNKRWGLFRGNLDSKAPFIIQISKGARSYTHKLMLEGLIRSADQVFPRCYFCRPPGPWRRRDLLRLHQERLL